jgi:hypothetical protein
MGLLVGLFKVMRWLSVFLNQIGLDSLCLVFFGFSNLKTKQN